MHTCSAPARLASIEWQVTRRMSANDAAQDELSTPHGRALLSEAAALGASRALLSGGDPAVRADLVDLVAHGREVGLGVRVSAPPLPHALAAALPALGSAGLRGVTATLQGPDGKAHDAACATRGSFAATIELLQAAREAGLAIEVRTALLPGRLRVLPAVAQLVAAIGAARWIVVAPVGSSSAPDERGSPPGAPLGALTLERALVTLADLAAAHRFEVVAVAAPHLARVVRMRHGGSPQGPAGRVHVERDGVERLFVSATGEVTPSAELPIRIGTVHSQNSDGDDSWDGAPGGSSRATPAPLAAALDHPMIEALGSGESLGGKCGVCSFQKLCGGSRARAFAAKAEVWAEDPSCVYVPKAARNS